MNSSSVQLSSESKLENLSRSQTRFKKTFLHCSLRPSSSFVVVVVVVTVVVVLVGAAVVVAVNVLCSFAVVFDAVVAEYLQQLSLSLLSSSIAGAAAVVVPVAVAVNVCVCFCCRFHCCSCRELCSSCLWWLLLIFILPNLVSFSKVFFQLTNGCHNVDAASL